MRAREFRRHWGESGPNVLPPQSLCSTPVMNPAMGRFIGLAAAVALVGAVPACSSGNDQAAATGEVRVGLLAPISGTHAAEGRAVVQGAQLAADVVNGSYPAIQLPLAAGTGIPAVGGAKLRLISADSRSDVTLGGRQAADLVARNVAGIVGAYDVAVTQAASQRTERSGVPWINGDTSARYLTDLGLDWFFRIGPSDRSYGEAFFSLLR